MTEKCIQFLHKHLSIWLASSWHFQFQTLEHLVLGRTHDCGGPIMCHAIKILLGHYKQALQSVSPNSFPLSWPLYEFSLPWRLQPRWSLHTFIFPFSASARTSYSSTYHSSDTVAWNSDTRITNAATLAIKMILQWNVWRKGYVQRGAYLEAMNLLINLSNQPMEELDVIKRWRTLLQEDTENVMSDEIK